MSPVVAGVTPTATPRFAARWWAAVTQRFAVYGGAPGARLVGIDIARGIAVLGMFAAHTVVVDAFEWSRPETWLDVVNGRSSILFATLAGVSIALISGRQVPLEGTALLQARTRILIRAVLIFALGGLLEMLGTPVAVILPMYAVLFVLSLPFLRWKPWALFVLAGSLAITMPFLQSVLTGLLGGQGSRGVIVDLLVTGTYPGMIWIVFVLLGLAVGRLDLRSLRVRVWLLAAGLVLSIVGYGIGAAADSIQPEIDYSGSSSSSSGSASSSGSEFDFEEGVPSEEIDFEGLVCDRYDETVSCYPEGYYDDTDDAIDPVENLTFIEQVRLALSGLFTAHAHSGTTIEVFASGGFALVIIVLSLFAATARVGRWLLFPIAAVGAMALSAYSAHILALAIIGATYDYTGAVLAPFVITALVVCSVWALLLGRGPLERLLTWVSHRAARGSLPGSPTEVNHPIPRA